MLVTVILSTFLSFVIQIVREKGLHKYIRWFIQQVIFICISIKHIACDFTQKKYNKIDFPKLTDKVAIITGGTRGIGAEIVRLLLKCDLDVVIASRNEEAANKMLKSIRNGGVSSGKVTLIKLENSSLESVRNFVSEFKSRYDRLDILINNAGVMHISYQENADGLEHQYVINYLSHFLLTSLLIPCLNKAGSPDHCSRVVNVSSCAHLMGKIEFDNINKKKDFFDTEAAYAQSKLAQVVSTKWFARYFQENELNINIHSVHPGIIPTGLFYHENSYLIYFKFLKPFLKSPYEAAISIVYAAINPKIEKKNGLYLNNCLEAPVNPAVNDQSIQDKLYELSMNQVKLSQISA